MVGRVLHSREFLLDLRAVLTREAPALLEQPVAQTLETAGNLCDDPDANDYDPRLRNALGTVAHQSTCCRVLRKKAFRLARG